MVTRWEQFLNETVSDAGKILELQEFFGVCLANEGRAGKALVLSGAGSNGKTVMVEILRDLVGEALVSFVDIESACPFGLSPLVGKRLNISEILEFGPLVKSVVDGDVILIERKYKEPVEYLPNCNLVYMTNPLPTILDRDAELASRLLIISMARVFVGSDRDPVLLDKLRANFHEIVSWSLIGLDRWRDRHRA